MSDIERQERGWAGHFIGADYCQFRRNTLLGIGNIRIVVSTVGAYVNNERRDREIIGVNRYYETMVFHSDDTDSRYHDADVSREIHLNGNWGIGHPDGDDHANFMHEDAVLEITSRMLAGEFSSEKTNTED